MGKENLIEKRSKVEALKVQAKDLREAGNIFAASRIEQKIARKGAIKLGINKIGTPKKRETQKINCS